MNMFVGSKRDGLLKQTVTVFILSNSSIFIQYSHVSNWIKLLAYKSNIIEFKIGKAKWLAYKCNLKIVTFFVNFTGVSKILLTFVHPNVRHF